MPRAQIAWQYWHEAIPEKCGVCLNPLDGEFFNGDTRTDWKNVCMCPHCKRRWGAGDPQRYTKQADGRYLRTV